MRNVIALALLLAFGATAQANYAPVDVQRAEIAPDDLAISTRPAGATLERDYFRAPQPADSIGRAFFCRPQRPIFDKTRLAQSCN
jgi:hypothetical protein